MNLALSDQVPLDIFKIEAEAALYTIECDDV